MVYTVEKFETNKILKKSVLLYCFIILIIYIKNLKIIYRCIKRNKDKINNTVFRI